MRVRLNGHICDVPQGCSIACLLQRLQLDARHVAVEVNLQLVPRTHHAEFQLNEDDDLEVVTLAGGG